MSERERRGEGDKKKEKETGREEGGWVEGDKKGRERDTQRGREHKCIYDLRPKALYAPKLRTGTTLPLRDMRLCSQGPC